MRAKFLHREVLEHFAERSAPARVGKVIQAPIRIQHGDAVGFESGPHFGFENREIDGNGGGRRTAAQPDQAEASGMWTTGS